jgi:TatD DNase family protein
MRLIDTHCHYNMEPLYSGKEFIFNFKANDPLLNMTWQDHWQNAQEKGIVGSVVVGTMIETSNLALEIAKTDPNLIATVGVHPNHAHEVTVEQLDQAAQTWTKQKFHAVGETGLDYYRLNRSSADFQQTANNQKEILHWHLKLAEQYNLPLILHVRDKTDQAYREILGILKKEYQGDKPFVLHCASGPADYIKEALKLGAYIGFDGNITYPKAQEVRDLVDSVPADRLLVETDAPFLSPQSKRGRVCEPWMIMETAKYVEEELDFNLEQIFENTQLFFDHPFVK